MTYSNIRRQVAQIANALRHSEGFTASAAFKQAWKVVKAKIAMATGKVKFAYTKKDGTLRPATGTTDPAVTGYTKKEGAKVRKFNPIYVRYFDVTAQGFRQFSAASFLAA